MLGHVHIKVNNLKRSVDFYTSILPFKITEIAFNYAFLSLGKRHHDLALQELPDASPQKEDAIGLYHIAFEISSEKELAQLAKKLQQKHINFSPVDHGISKSIYFEDPDNNGIEVYVDTRSQEKQQLWTGQNRELKLL